MLFYALKRFGVAVLVLISVSLITFALLRFSGHLLREQLCAAVQTHIFD